MIPVKFKATRFQSFPLIACNVSMARPAIASIFPAVVSMMKGASIMQSAPTQEAKPIIRSTPRP